MNAFTIKDLENLSGIKAHTIRIWEQRYHFLKPQRTSTNIRYYSNEELKTVLNIALLNKYGFKISHLDKMQPAEIQEQVLSLDDTRAVQERFVNELVREMVDLEMDRFEKIMDGYILSKGIERTVIQVVFPFLEKIGILWQTGNINPVQEHLVSNIIRQKLIAGIEKVLSPVKMNRSILLFLPEGEHHELGLLFIHFLLKSRGLKTIYIGANVPIKDVEHIIQLKSPEFAFVHLTGGSINLKLDRFIGIAGSRFGNTRTVISGQPTSDYRKKTPPTVVLKRSLAEIVDFIASL